MLRRAAAAWPELAEDLELIIMLTPERLENYTRDLTTAKTVDGFWRLTPAQRRRVRHKGEGATIHSHLPDPERPGRIVRCGRCRPLPRLRGLRGPETG